MNSGSDSFDCADTDSDAAAGIEITIEDGAVLPSTYKSAGFRLKAKLTKVRLRR